MIYTNVVIYHANCADGFGAAWAAWKVLKDAAIYLPVQYGEEPPYQQCEGKAVCIVDFSYPKEMLLRLDDCANGLAVLDHHKTAQRDLDGLSFATFDMDHSGAMLAWKYFHHDSAPPLFIEYIQDRDLWQWALPQSREVSAALHSYPYEFSVWDDLSMNVNQLRLEGVVLLRAKDQLVKRMADHAVVGNVGGHQVHIVNATVFFSEVGEELCLRYPDEPFAAYYFDRTDRRQWGLRSRGDFDCSVVATLYGGGGHPGAAGFTTLKSDLSV